MARTPAWTRKEGKNPKAIGTKCVSKLIKFSNLD